ncbi:hypothetical protein KUH03_12150 [Sphingobacterium sp. E70]|uniref:hypothetical protein n=1 Tax=Sphingobacterium sp. E70 TaxID=2853439 RepID=UPI00211C023B|nr:hypothetical protein [Sphingobacterium sp. E70]ULT27429.1 hypothetical protein KUH03_12150 [Sphingobacterium sp. E70]
MIKVLRLDPMVLRIPISLARVAALAVDRLTKLMHAISRMKNAIPANPDHFDITLILRRHGVF